MGASPLSRLALKCNWRREQRRVSDLATGEQKKSAHGVVDGARAAQPPLAALAPPAPAALASPRSSAVLAPPTPERLRPPPAAGHAHATNPYTHE
jgi:hypothetical protein